MVQIEGPKALWRGLLPTMLRDVPFSGIYWMGYERIKHRLSEGNNLSHFQTSFIAGASSGMVRSSQAYIVIFLFSKIAKKKIDCCYCNNPF